MKIISYIFIIIFIIGCTPYKGLVINKFFVSIPCEPKSEVSQNTIHYKEEYFDHHFPNLGKIKVPQRELIIKYDTMSRYVVLLKGYIHFENNSHKFKTEDMKFVSLNGISIWKLANHRKHWEFTQESIDSFYKCPIPVKHLSVMKEDFFFVNKNSMFDIEKNDSNSCIFPITLSYKLY